MSSVPTLAEAHNEIQANFDKEIKGRYESFKEKKAKLDKFYCFLQESLAHGFVPNFYMPCITMWGDYEIKMQNLKDFSTIHKIVGHLQRTNMTPLKDDARCRKVTITMQPVDKAWRFLQFTYIKDLPRGSKCKVKKQTYDRYSVQCEI